MRVLADSTWPEVGDRPVVLLPVGSTEQHGPHLPLDTDAVIANAVACRVAEIVGGHVVVAPALPYGASGEHQDFAGTSSIGSETLHAVIVELARSMQSWAGPVVIINGHGGNAAGLSAAVTQLRREGHDVEWVACTVAGSDAHAGFAETSLMLHLRPSAVRIEQAAAGNTAPLAELLPALMRDGVLAASANGVLGDPAGASAGEGARQLESMARDVASVVRERIGPARECVR